MFTPAADLDNQALEAIEIGKIPALAVGCFDIARMNATRRVVCLWGTGRFIGDSAWLTQNNRQH